MTHSLSLRLMCGASALLLSSCAVGPDFEPPKAPSPERYTEADMPATTASADGAQGAAQTFRPGQQLHARWWEQFQSPRLNALVEEALKNNPDVKAAQASLRQAKEMYLATRGDLLPSVDLNAGPTRQKFNPSSFGQTGAPSSIFTLYNASVSVSYGIDIFGGTRREVEASSAEADYARYELAATYLSLTANVVTAAIQEASLMQQIAETRQIADIEGKQLGLLNKQFEFGSVPKTSILAQQTELAQTLTTLPPLQKQLAQTHNQLTLLTGKLPADGAAEPFELAGLKLPEELPVSLPSQLVDQRPDIQAAQAQLHAASAEIGVATAAMLPQLALTGSYGSQTVSFPKLLSSGAEVWSIGGNLLQPLFRGGSLLHQKRAAKAAFEKSQAQYEGVVLTAFKNVADTLRALQFDAEGLKAQVGSSQAAKTNLDLTQDQYKVGAISYPQLLDAQRAYSQSRIGLVQAQASRLSDTVALFQSLGGGWKSPAAKAQPVVTAIAPEPSAPAAVIQPVAATTTPATPATPETATAIPGGIVPASPSVSSTTAPTPEKKP